MDQGIEQQLKPQAGNLRPRARSCAAANRVPGGAAMKEMKEGTVRKPRRGRGRPFVKGQSGNPGGRKRQDPATLEWYDELRKAKKAGLPKLFELAERQEQIAAKALEEVPAQGDLPAKTPNLAMASSALKQAFDAHREIKDSVEGRPIQQQGVAGADGEPAKVVVEMVWPV